MLYFIKKVVTPIITGTYLAVALFSWAPVLYAQETKVYYFLTDHLGSVDVVLDENGEVVERRDFFPYGAERMTEGTDSDTDRGFTGKELDEETGLSYYGARYYDSEIGRFISVDPWEGDLGDPQSLNKYAYVRNNPVRFVDPEGEFFIPAIIAIAAFTVAYFGSADVANAPDIGEVTIPAQTEVGRVTTMAKDEAVGGLIGGGLGYAIKIVAKPVTSLVSRGFKTVSELKIFRKLVGEGIDEATAATKAKLYAPDSPLPRNKNGMNLPSSDKPHTQLGTHTSKQTGDTYRQTRTWGENGNVEYDIDWTDHGYSDNHSDPHVHDFLDNPTGGTKIRSKNNKPLNNE